MLFDPPPDFGLREPDEIFKVNRNISGHIFDVELKFGACRGIGERISNFSESSGVAQVPGCLFEIVVARGSADLQPAFGGDFGFGVALASDDFDRNQLARRGWQLRNWLLRGKSLPEGQPVDAGEEHKRQQSRRGHHHRAGACTNSWVDLCFTAISMNARAARLRALSLRNTNARSRRTWPSAIAMTASTLARTSSSTLERAIKPIPTSAATKRFNSSLESSSMEKFGFNRRS